MKKMLFALSAFACAMSIAHAATKGHAPHWDYVGAEGPSHWAELNPSFETCAVGTRQSPINISQAQKTKLPVLEFEYGEITPVIWNNGHTVQVNVPAGNFLKIDGKKYELLQFHFHTPSEEQIDGKHSPMVAHFVHKDAEGRLAVVGILMGDGPSNQAMSPVFSHIPRPDERITVDGLTLNLKQALPSSKGYYTFEGSLTTPPCSEGVRWIVMKQAVTVEPQNITAFHQAVKSNARPVQALNGRMIEETDD